MRPAVFGLAVAACLLAATATTATGPAELGLAIDAVRTAAAVRADAAWEFEAEKKLVAMLNRAADRFHRLAGQGAALAAEAETLLAVMESTRERYTTVIEDIQAEVIRIDGDLEAAQDSSDWRQREELAMRLLYRSNWVRYEVATR